VHLGKDRAEQINQPKEIPFDYGITDNLRIFNGSHPNVMSDRITCRNWDWIPGSQPVISMINCLSEF